MSKLLWHLDPEQWEDFKVKREPRETEHWRVGTFEIEVGPGYWHYVREGRDTGLGTFTGLWYRADHPAYTRSDDMYDARMEWRPMMSDTQAEILDHIEILDKASWGGLTILITGLGLGMVAEACANADNQVHVVEHDPEILELMADQVAHPNITIHQGNAYTWVPPEGVTFDLAWHDIWPTIRAENLPQMKRMKAHYRRYMANGWQGCWAYEQCKWLARQNRQDPTGETRARKQLAKDLGPEALAMFDQLLKEAKERDVSGTRH